METTPTNTGENNRSRWQFFRAGGVDQVRLDTGAAIANLAKLDQKLWVALSCPVKGLEFDERTLAVIDTDKDGRVRVPEVIAAINWAVAVLKNPDDLTKESPSLPLSAINDATPEGKQLLASAKQILVNLGQAEAKTITVDDTMDLAKIFGQTRFNGDGLITAETATDPVIKQVVTEIIGTHGSETDRSGQPGISQARVDAFFADAAAYSDWQKKAETDAAVILPLGETTAPARAALKAVQIKIDDYFARCCLAAFDSRALSALNRQEAEFLALAAKDLTVTSAEIAGFPLARIEPHKSLPLKDSVNPAWADALAAFNNAVVAPLIGKEKAALTEAEWKMVQAKFAPYEAWLAAKAGAAVEKLGLVRVREILAGKARAELTKLIDEDKKLEPEANSIVNVERLARYYRDLHRLLVNFVSFEDFYGRKRKAVFQAGTLFLDGRSCDLCVRVDDTGKHVALAGLAKTFLVYCDCSRVDAGKMTIAAAFTDGDSDNLMVGRNGVFYDRKGRDWDVTITKIIENPISIRQAFWSPYKKLVRLIEEQVAKRAASADADANAKLAAVADATTSADKAKAAAKPAEPKKIDVGTVAALGVAVGAISAALATILAKAAGLLVLPFWQMCIAFGIIIIAISTPAMLIAWLKLRQRNLGPILDANGWAVNGRMKVNVPLGRSLTLVAKLPPGTQPALNDPFGAAPSLWPKIVAFVVVIAFVISLLNHFGLVYKLSGERFGKRVESKENTSGNSSTNNSTTTITTTLSLTNAPGAKPSP
jgi:hypothetical protein